MTQPNRTTGRFLKGAAGFRDLYKRMYNAASRSRDTAQYVDAWTFNMAAPLTQFGIAGGGGPDPPPTDNTPGIWQVKDKTLAFGASYDFTLGLTTADATSARGFFTAVRGTNVWSGDFVVMHDGTTGGGGIVSFRVQPANANTGLTISGVVSAGAFLLRIAADSIDGSDTAVNLIYHVGGG